MIQLWQQALAFALGRLGDGGGHRLLSCHLTLYSYRSNEFYSPIALSAFPPDLVPSSVLILLDDVFDMFERLRQPGQVYEACESDYIRRAANTEPLELDCEGGSDGRVGGGSDQKFLLCQHLRFESRVNALQQLLAWRRADMVLGELVAAQWPEARVAFVGTKQDKNALARWLREDQPIAYLSHPISRPRQALRRMRKADSSTDWQAVDVVGQFNELQVELGSRDVFAIMPTAIDEFRLAKGDDPLSRLPTFDDRWPIPDRSDVLYKAPSPAGPEYTDLLNVGAVYDEGSVVGMLRALEMGIRDQIAFRDHLLVAHTEHLIVFRPLYEKGEFSAGVLAEIQHWESLAQIERGRRALFIHAKPDLEALQSFLERDQNRAIFDNAIDSLRRNYLRTRRHMTESQIDSLATTAASDLQRGPGRAGSEWATWDSEAKPLARASVLWHYLTRVANSEGLEAQVTVLIVEQLTRDTFDAMASFLKTGDRTDVESWDVSVKTAIPDSWLVEELV